MEIKGVRGVQLHWSVFCRRHTVTNGWSTCHEVVGWYDIYISDKFESIVVSFDDCLLSANDRIAQRILLTGQIVNLALTDNYSNAYVKLRIMESEHVQQLIYLRCGIPKKTDI